MENRILRYSVVSIIAITLAITGAFAQAASAIGPEGIVLKVRDQYRSSCQPGIIQLPAFQQHLQNDDRVSSVAQAFPTIGPPKSEFDRNGMRLVDISLVYHLQTAPGADVRLMCIELLRLGLFEYVEPHFTYPVLYNPNDPMADSASGSQWQLRKIRAHEAWNINRGDSSKVIGILDTGTKYDHPDLLTSVKYSETDPVDGLDNDLDGYIDNYRGYDLSDSDNDASWTTSPHGIIVTGAASATADNGLQLAGPGFKCKYLPIKVYGNSFKGYEGIVYAATHGVASINLSWGGYANGYQQFEQDVINFAVINNDVPVIAAGGNTSGEYDFYPASYDNVLSVAISKINDELPSTNATYSTRIDIQAPGYQIRSTWKDGGTTTGIGSSYASPIVAAAVAVASNHFPSYSAQQLMEQVRVTADKVDTLPANRPYLYKLGKGRLNMFRALTISSPAVRIADTKLSSGGNEMAMPGDTVDLSFSFLNFLAPTSALDIALHSTSPYITLLDTTFSVGVLGTMAVTDNHAQAFRFVVSPSAPANTPAYFRLSFEDGVYNDYEFEKVLLNQNYFDLDINELVITVPANGRFGYEDNYSKNGKGMTFDGMQVLYEGGFMVGYDAATVSDCIRNNVMGRNQDFEPMPGSGYVISNVADQEVRTYFHDTAVANAVGITVQQRSFAWSVDTLEDFVILEYEVTNTSNRNMDSVFVGFFLDADIGNYARNSALWDTVANLGYAYNVDDLDAFIGAKLLTGQQPGFYGLDISSSTINGNLNMSDGFSDAEKYQSLSKGIGRSQAGIGGYDIGMVFSAKVENLQIGQTSTVTYAMIGGSSLGELEQSASQAQAAYRISKSGPQPIASDVNACKGTPNQSVTPTGGMSYNFYSDEAQTDLLGQGTSFAIPLMDSSFNLYVTNNDSLLFESFPTKVLVNSIGDFAEIEASKDTVYFKWETDVQFYNLSPNAVTQTWDFDNGSTSTTTDPVSYFTLSGTYDVQLITTDSYGCTDTAYRQIFGRSGAPPTPLPLELLSFAGRYEEGRAVLRWVTLDEYDVSHFLLERSADGDTWGMVAELKARNVTGPNQYSYPDESPNSSITQYYRLRSVDLDGSYSLSDVIALNTAGMPLRLYPNPASNSVTVLTSGAISKIELINSIGNTVKEIKGIGGNRQKVMLGDLSRGMYLVKVSTEAGFETIRLVVR